MMRALVILLLAILLAGCSPGNPPSRVVERAIALQLNQTQSQLGQLLYRDTVQLPQTTVKHVTVSQREQLPIQQILLYHLQGTYDLTLKFPDHKVTQRRNPFDLYLQQQGEEDTWYLARPQGGNQHKWEKTLIEL